MSGVVEDAERRAEEEAYQSFLLKLVEYGDVQGDAAGITRFVIANGIEKLSKKQRYVFKKEVEDEFPQPTCEDCEAVIPWVEAYEHIHENSRCASCEYTYEKFMRD